MDNEYFAPGSEEVVIPGEELRQKAAEQQRELKHIEDVREAIMGGTVTRVVFGKEREVYAKNFVLDLRQLGGWSILQKMVVKSLIKSSDKPAGVAVYISVPKKDLLLLGFGDEDYLDTVLPIVKSEVFLDKIRVYKDFTGEDVPTELGQLEYTDFRLNL